MPWCPNRTPSLDIHTYDNDGLTVVLIHNVALLSLGEGVGEVSQWIDQQRE